MSTQKNSSKATYPVSKPDAEWRSILSPEQFRVLRTKGTETPYTGKYNNHFSRDGVYSCVGCGAPLYKADTKFSSQCGWPAFFESIPGAVERLAEDANFVGMPRIEILCANCGGHLGHVFEGEGYATPTDERHCVNSASLNFNDQK